MKVCLTGDLFLGGDLNNKSATDIVRAAAFKNADVRVSNLEQPISNSADVAEKCTLYTGSYAVAQLEQLGISVVNLANNHIHDKGLAGIIETTEHLKNGGVNHFGGGKNMNAAQVPFYIADNVALLGYCDFDQPYLKQVIIATDTSAGVNPLRLEKILADLDQLPDGVKAILYLHWGREHVWLPPHQNLEIARTLLRHDKVLHIIGMHAHRIQGYITVGGKRAYMCLGNFLFPNFFIRPPTQVSHGCEPDENYDITRQYHSVSAPTYKKWKAVNRRSLIVTIDTKNNRISHHVVGQNDDRPVVDDCSGVRSMLTNCCIRLMNIIYRAPKPLYIAIERPCRMVHSLLWRAGILGFRLRQVGVRGTFSIVLEKLKGRA